MKHALFLVLVSSSVFAAEPLEPVVIAAVDIPAGTVVTMEMISQRSVPKRLVSSSYVKPDSASYIINQPTRRPMLAGDFMAWNNFDAPDTRVLQACEKGVSKGAASTAADQVSRARAAIVRR